MSHPRRDDEDDLETQADGPGGPSSRPRPDEDDRETLASAPGPAPAPPPPADPPAADFDPFGLESIVAKPRRTPTPTPLPRATPLPPGVTRPPQSFTGRRPPDDDEEPPTGEQVTVAGPAPEAMGRDVETHAGGFAQTERSSPPRPGAGEDDAEDETVADVGLTERQKAMLDEERSRPQTHEGVAPTVADRAASTGASPRPASPVPASKFSRGTARDPVAGTAAGRGTVPGVAPAGPTALREGMLLADRYELVRRLGKGGMGEVWQARHTLLQGMRAIKVIKASISRDPSFRARFLSEGQTMMRVKHPGVVEVTDLDETRQNRELFMVMEFLQGRTLHDAVRDAKAPLAADVRDAARIFMELAVGMQRIHDERIVHKDLKTDNVVLVKGEDGREHPKVIDFGLAKRMEDRADVPVEQGAASADAPATASQTAPDLRTTLSGTLAYMAPEQFLGEPSSFRSDVYAYGVMLYETFTRGDYPMPRGSLGDYVKRHKAKEVPRRLRQARPDLDPFVAELADRCMAPDRAQRPESFAEIAARIRWWLEAPERARLRRKRVLTTSAAAALAGVAVWGFFFQGQKASVARIALLGPDGATPLDQHAERFHLAATALASVRVEATATSPDAQPVVEVDGVPLDAALTVEPDGDGAKLTGALDLSRLADGEHVLGIRAEPRAAPTTQRIVVDRAPPRVLDVRLAGDDDRFTREDNPAVWIDVDTPQAGLRGVRFAVGDSEEPAVADRASDRRWTVRGAHRGDGEVVLRIVATDLAGNVSAPHEFRFVRDTAAPLLDVKADGLEGDVLQVRDPAGNRLVVVPGEDGRLRVAATRAGETVPATQDHRAAAGTPIEALLPDVPPGAMDVAVVLTDVAGNETTRTLRAKVVADVTTLNGGRPLAAQRSEDAAIRAVREYAMPSSARVVAARVRGADGAPVAPSPATLPGAQVAVDPARPREATVTLPPGLAPGEYALRIEGLSGPPLALVVDPDPPVVGAVALRDAEGRDVPPRGWCLTQDATVTVEVSDLAPARIELDGVAAAETPAPGRATYTFRRRFDREGEASLSLFAVDTAGNETKRTIDVRADWTDPSVTVSAPAPGAALDTITPVVFAGSASEPGARIVVAGLPGGERVHQAAPTATDFEASWLVEEAGDRVVRVRAEDRAGRRSAPVEVALSVALRQKELPPQITWSGPVAVAMRQVAPGDVVLGGRTHPVERCFVDRTEVTNRQYRAFLAAIAPHDGRRAPWDHPDQPANWSHVPAAETWNDPRWNADDLPVVNVAWWDAYAFAKWSGRRLPTEAEWVKAAAKAPGELELRAWPPIPEGGAWKDGVLATAETAKGPVDATKGDDVSPVECLHMGGNVSEWVDVKFPREGERTTGVRGGSFWTTQVGADCRLATKPYDPSYRQKTIGFRCAVDASEVRQ